LDFRKGDAAGLYSPVANAAEARRQWQLQSSAWSGLAREFESEPSFLLAQVERLAPFILNAITGFAVRVLRCELQLSAAASKDSNAEAYWASMPFMCSLAISRVEIAH
jgi:hypothetical protein